MYIYIYIYIYFDKYGKSSFLPRNHAFIAAVRQLEASEVFWALGSLNMFIY